VNHQSTHHSRLLVKVDWLDLSLLIGADDWCARQHVRVQSYVRVWKSWIRLVECDLEVTITQGGKPEKHALRIVRPPHPTSSFF
jgi:hypothetical protein